jgi:septal ring factor EnvC (AmiA/AmiB activator)
MKQQDRILDICVKCKEMDNTEEELKVISKQYQIKKKEKKILLSENRAQTQVLRFLLSTIFYTPSHSPCVLSGSAHTHNRLVAHHLKTHSTKYRDWPL